ncbi:MAG: Sarcosine oxidase beta subunit, partial [uncultured Nocardioidaceae bacterium]
GLAAPAGGCCRSRRRHGRWLVRTLPARGRAAQSGGRRTRAARQWCLLARRRHGTRPGRHPTGRGAGQLDARLLPRSGRGPRPAQRLRRAGLLPTCVHRGPARRGTGADAHAAGARARSGMAGAGRGRAPQPDPGHRRHPGRHVRRPGRLPGPAAQRDGLCHGPAYRAGARRRRHRVPRSAIGHGRCGQRCGHLRGQHRHGPGRAHRRAGPARRRRPGRSTCARRRRAPPGRGHRAASRARAGPAADGVRRRRWHLLATGGRRPAVRDEQPRRAAGPGARGGLGVSEQGARAVGRAGSGHHRPRSAQGVGGHDRLHTRPSPRDRRRAGCRRGAAARRDGRSSRRPRDDVGSRGVQDRGRPRPGGAYVPAGRGGLPAPRPRARSLRRARPQQARRGPDRTAVPRGRGQL